MEHRSAAGTVLLGGSEGAFLRGVVQGVAAFRPGVHRGGGWGALSLPEGLPNEEEQQPVE